MAMLGSPHWTTTTLGLITSSCCLSVSNIVLQIICVAHTTKRCRWLYRLVERPRWHCTANEDDVRLSFTWTEQAECTDALTWCPCGNYRGSSESGSRRSAAELTARVKWCSRMRRQRSTPSCRSSTSNSTVRPSPISIDSPWGWASFEYRPVCRTSSCQLSWKKST